MMFKRLAAFGLAAVMACSLAFPAAAEYVEDKELTIGTALAETAEEFERDSYYKSYLVKYNGDSETVTIPSNVKKISSGAFSGNTKIKSITIPASVTEIGAGAFKDCTSLKTIKVDKGNPNFEVIKGVLYEWRKNSGNEVKWLHTYPVTKTDKSFTVPSGVYGVNSLAFSNNKSLETVKFSDTVKEIGNLAFRNCSKLTKITLTDNVTKINDNPFYECPKLQSISGMSFTNSNQSEYVTIGGVLYESFEHGDGGRMIYYPEGKTDKTFTIPEALISAKKFPEYANRRCSIIISESSIRNNKYLKKLILTSGTDFFYSGPLFSGCTALESIDLSKRSTTDIYVKDGVLFRGSHYGRTNNSLLYYPAAKSGSSYTVPTRTSIIPYAFSQASKLKTLTFSENTDIVLGGSLKASFIGSETSSISTIKVDSKNTELSAKDGILYNKDKTKLLCVPPQYAKTSLKIPASVSSVDRYAFTNCTKLESVVVPRGVTTIYFENCKALKTVTLPLSAPGLYGAESPGGGYGLYIAECDSLEKVIFNGLRENFKIGEPYFGLRDEKLTEAYKSGKLKVVCADD